MRGRTCVSRGASYSLGARVLPTLVRDLESVSLQVQNVGRKLVSVKLQRSEKV